MLFGDVWGRFGVRVQSTLRAVRRGATRRSPRARLRSFERVETLESRSLPTGLALIAGTVFDDLAGDGLTLSDPVLTGVTVSLYRDGGNGVFDGGAGGGDDVLLATDSTDAQGQYEFEYLSEGRYFVEQAAVAGHQQRPGANIVTQDVSATDALGVPGVLIDDFSTTVQATQATTSRRTNSSSVAAVEAIGGERDFFLQLTSATGTLSLDSDDVTPDVLEFTASAVAAGRRVVTWDGVDGDGLTLDPTGLGGVDLTNGGQSRYLKFLAGADHPDGALEIRVYSDATNWSLASVAMPNTGGAATATLLIPLDAFVVQAGTGANMASVGAIEQEVTGGAAVDLFEDTDASGDFTPGVDTLIDSTTTNASGLYLFDSLFPSVYVVRIRSSNFASGGALTRTAC